MASSTSASVSSPRATAVSAPGKVLLAGGYLVLDRAYTGLVFGLSARIHVLVQEIATGADIELADMVVQSPQFRDASWTYGYRQAGEHGGVEVTQRQGKSTTPSSRNPFVETALAYALTYISTHLTSPITASKITILADDDYYSNTSATTLPSSPFTDFGVPLLSAHKTGLGSSAALTVSMVKQVLEWRKQRPDDAKRLWDDLQGSNDVLAERLTKGCAIELAEAFIAIRALIKDMTRESGVPIEPQEQTELLDAVTRAVRGVSGGVVPGAGGYDAVVLLVRDDEETMGELRRFLEGWREKGKGNVKLLDAKGELEGAREEDAKSYGQF
ncbi:hypothetical protein QTJ16_006324 [Diplocarpon rosae]|uniref:phosphomevalonate kinase n=1 Tax=Diplocarpon rosae TaxID=946125 RepID=A0AAD9SWE7_9HELO|nr:hypothetical protein QTJ16_006324 [Diplocarpon rosae]